MTMPPSQTAEPVLQRIEASPAEVFAAWVTREDIEDWWGPEGFTTIVKQMDVVEGGRFSFEMTARDGASCLMTGTYRKIEPPHLLVFEVLSHCNLGLPDGVAPQHEPSLVTVRLLPDGPSTKVLVSQGPLNDTYGDVARHSWRIVLSKLALCVGGKRQSALRP